MDEQVLNHHLEHLHTDWGFKFWITVRWEGNDSITLSERQLKMKTENKGYLGVVVVAHVSALPQQSGLLWAHCANSSGRQAGRQEEKKVDFSHWLHPSDQEKERSGPADGAASYSTQRSEATGAVLCQPLVGRISRFFFISLTQHTGNRIRTHNKNSTSNINFGFQFLFLVVMLTIDRWVILH